GKTSLLDVIRKTSVSAHEAGGITQHIGAYQVLCKDKKIVFLDTPGHEAFTAMRARGAQVTDIAILVVAADDGVMPQTVEAIHHAKSANVPIIVAINKIDKPGANPDRVIQELMEHGLVPEEYGGDNIMVPVSAKKQIGINELLENILLVAEVQELKANPNREARGVVIEAQLDKGRGTVATVLVQSGTLRIGDSMVAGTTYGKVRAMVNDRGDNVKKAGPSVPVEVLGLNDVPAAGDIFAVLDEKQAKSIAEHRIERQRTQLIRSKKVSLDDLFQQIQEGSIKDLNIVVKADVQGSVEALNSSLLALNKNDEVRVSIVHSGVGAVNESDVMLASASNALIIAFNVRPDANARRVADAEDIDIRTYRVIYDALNDVKAAMSGMLAPKFKEVVQGRVEIRMVMKFSKALVAGSYVLEGKIFNNSKIRIIRDNIEIFDGEIDSLRRFKDEVKEVAAGYECGISIVDFRDFREGDIIEAYTMEEVETSIAEANKAAAARRAEEAAAHEAQQAQSSEE
ncbi:MAG: translation initiation factor IF-2, partial [Selenomonadaceae bacterium]|nr:translation initiation factor IF-2 [Selenomonadaceae bacterium]